MHFDHEDPVQEMLIALGRNCAVMPNRSVGRSESLQVVKGELLLIIFDDNGNVVKRVEMGPAGSDKVFLYRLSSTPWHTMIPLTKMVVVHEALEESAMNLGASRSRVLATIVIPLIGINIFSGALISFVYSVAEVSTSITIGRIHPIDEGYAPMTAVMYEYLTGGYGGGNYIHIVAAMATLILVVQLLVITLTNVVLKQRYAFIGV